MLDLDATPASVTPSVIAAACRIRNEHANADTFNFLADGIEGTEAVIRIHTHNKPIDVLVAGKPLDNSHYEIQRDSLQIRFQNSAQPIPVEIDFTR